MAGVHGRHGVVEKKQSGLGDKVWFEMSIELFSFNINNSRIIDNFVAIYYNSKGLRGRTYFERQNR